jgi:hypothetical protein
MSDFPTVFEPKGAFTFLLARIKEYNLTTRKLGILPHLKAFIADPIIQELLDCGKDPTTVEPNNQTAEDLNIQSTLQSLTKAIASIQKQLKPHPKAQAAPPKKGSGANNSKLTKMYAAIISTCPPNPSLVVDSGPLFVAEKNWPTPGELCQQLNEMLCMTTLTPITLSAVRWTAKGNLVVTAGPNMSAHALQASASFISEYLTEITLLTLDNYILTA